MPVDTTVTIAIRRATEADAEAVRALLGQTPAIGEQHATFVMTEDGTAIGAIDVARADDHLRIEAVGVAETHRGRSRGAELMEFAEAVARDMGLKELQLGASVAPSPFFEKLGFAARSKHLRPLRHLESVGVPLLRDGHAPLWRVVYYRGVWAALAMIVGMGALSLAVFSRGELTLTLILAATAACLLGTLFALWQLALVVVAALRRGPRWQSVAVAAASALGTLLIGYAVSEKAVPQVTELYAIYRGDAELSGHQVEISPEGTILLFTGAFGPGATAAVTKGLDENKGVRTVALDSPGGRIGEGYAMFDLLRSRKMDTHVQEECSSACTVAFLGGVRRSVSQAGALGFHQGGFPGMNSAEMRDANRELENFMIRRAGVTRDFAARVAKTPHRDVWYPTHDELKAGRIIHVVTP